VPRGYTGSVFVVLHIAPDGTSVLPAILERAGHLQAGSVKDGGPPRPGCIYVAPPNAHLVVDEAGNVALDPGPKENGHRPAVDPLFRSVSEAYGARAVGIVLSGTRDDGTAGLKVLKDRGGVAIAQDPEEALYPGMPLNAIEHVQVDAIRRAEEIAALLVELAVDPIAEDAGAAREQTADPDELVSTSETGTGNSSGLTCPECSGALWERERGRLIQFQCRIGHVYSLESMLAEQARSVEAAIWAGVAALEERAELMRRISERAQRNGSPRVEHQFEQEAQDADRQASLLRRAVSEYAASTLTSMADPAEAVEGA